jgi:hypothetical protein
MADFFYRTEDIKPEDVSDYFVESAHDRAVIDALKNRNPTILVGSRGVGKSFLLRMAQKELMDEFQENRAFPVYMTFVRSSLLQSSDPAQFKHWMLARICAAISRSLNKTGVGTTLPKSAKVLLGSDNTSDSPSKLELIAEAYENSWKNPGVSVDASSVPLLDDVKDALEEISETLAIKRFVLLIDEASHIFLPEQQRQFFTLFRDLRSHCITCNAAVYPGVTSFGETFQPAHDATMLSVNRDFQSEAYVKNMREIVEKQGDSSILRNIATNARNFAILAYAASGNPRLLLKTLASAPRVNSTEVNDVIREYYRSDVWSEHSNLGDKYKGHRAVIDWGRQFIENTVLPELRNKNEQYIAADKATSAYIWVHRDAPEEVKEALRVLAYTGVLSEQDSGIKASRGEIGIRYVVNLGCLFALEPVPTSSAFDIAKGLTPKRMTEFGANHPAFKSLLDHVEQIEPQSASAQLKAQLDHDIDILDLSTWQKSKLKELKLHTVRDVFNASEEKLKEASYVGRVRARHMRNAAVAAVLEYLSG